MNITYYLGCYKVDPITKEHTHHMYRLAHKTEEDARRAYDALPPSRTYPQLELWKEIRDENGVREDIEKIAMKDSTGEWPWWEF